MLPNAACSAQAATALGWRRGAAAAAAATQRGRAGPPRRAACVRRRACRRRACAESESLPVKPHRSLKRIPKAVEAKRATRHRRKKVKQSGDERRRGIRLARDHRLCLGTRQHKAKLLWGHKGLSTCKRTGAHDSRCTLDAGAQRAPHAYPCQLQDELPCVSLACHVCGGRVERVQRNFRRIVPRQDLSHQETV